jgi:hypothetical protein
MAVATAPAFAQASDPGVGVGVNFGFTTNSVHGTDVTGAYKSRTGGLFGLWVGGNRNGLVGFTGEFNYLMGGYKDPSGSEIKQNIFEIPLLAHINFGSRSHNGPMFFGLVGPVLDFNLKSKIDDVDVSDNYNGFTAGVMAGAGLEAYRLGVQVRGNWGLRNVAKDLGTITDVKTRSIQILGTFRFN